MREITEGGWKQATLNGAYSGICAGAAYCPLPIISFNIQKNLLGFFDGVLNDLAPLFFYIIVPAILSILITITFLNFKKNKYLLVYLPISVVTFLPTLLVSLYTISFPAIATGRSDDALGAMWITMFLLVWAAPIGSIIGTIASIIINKVGDSNVEENPS